MAFTRPTGKHRARRRPTRRSMSVAGVATLTVSGVVGALSSQALAAEPEGPAAGQGSSTTQAIVIGDSISDTIAAQATAQRAAAEQAKRVAEARAEAKRKAEARAQEVREARQRAARAAARKRLNAFRTPVAHSYVSTGYESGGALWSSGSHTGIDFHAATGTEVVAVGAGTVVEAGWGGAYGNNVVIRMRDGMYTQYGHLSSIRVTVGQSVTPGERIALSGATGNATGPHLHFEARTGQAYGTDVDPLAYLRKHGVHV
ncbi:peptidase [Streptomyces sp. AcH 505]|uniref:M23 family metallopeptidase n=1 Tax=Streptomyces sp. AcH 505 TaxID=352211 RepID=UPI00059227CA|nr:peptidase [Streptomyces sp. AcH 505]